MVNKYDNYDLKRVNSLENVPGTIKDGDGYIWDPSELPDKDFDDYKVPLNFRRLAIWMRSKLFGKDVRETIARLAEMFGLNFKELMESFESLDDRQDALETQTAQSVAQMEADKDQMEAEKNAVIANVTVDSEVILARGGKTTLQARLDDSDAQLARNIKINVKDFGAVGDYNTNKTDDTNAINLAINEAKKYSKAVLIFPFANGGYVTTDTIHIPATIDVFMESPIVYIGTEDIVGLKVGSDERSNFHSELKLRFRRHNTSNWESEENIGIQVVNADSSKIEILETLFSTIGVQYIGYNHGFAYNECTHYYFVDNKIQVDVTNDLNGWANENNYYGGRLTNLTNTHLDKSRVGVRITSKETASIKDNNNNIFYKPSFELHRPNEGKKALPILIEHGRSNRFYDARNEFNSQPTMRTFNNSNFNYVSVGYSDTGVPQIDDVGTFMGNLGESNFNLIEDRFKPFFHLENLSSLLNPYDSSTNYVKKLHIRRSEEKEPMLNVYRGSVDFEGDSLKLTSGIGIGFYLDTTHQKKFDINWKSELGIHLAVVPFDKDNNRIVATNIKTDNPIRMTYASNLFGGCFYQGAPSSRTGFSVDEEVSRVEVILFAWGVGNDSRKINSFSVSAREPVAVTTAFPEFYDKAIAIGRPSRVTPATKNHSFIYRRNLTVTGANPKTISLGWVCINSKENTWKEVIITTND